jgi:hypothetical protein
MAIEPTRIKRKRGRPAGRASKPRSYTPPSQLVLTLGKTTPSLTDVASLTSPQIFAVLDTLLMRAAEPLFTYTTLGHEFIASSLSMLCSGRRHISSLKDDELLTKFFFAMLVDGEKAFEVIGDAKLDKVLLSHTLDVALSGRLPSLQGDAKALQRHLKVFRDDYDWFRAALLTRYKRFVRQQSGAISWSMETHGHHVEPEDVNQNLSMAALRGFDKFNSASGTLAGFVTNWLRNGFSSTFMLNMGEAFAVTRSQRISIAAGKSFLNNLSTTLETAEETPIDTEEEDALGFMHSTTKLFLTTAGMTQTHKWGLIACNIPFVLTQAEAKMLAETLSLLQETDKED